jgi:hypothetical protein
MQKKFFPIEKAHSFIQAGEAKFAAEGAASRTLDIKNAIENVSFCIKIVWKLQSVQERLLLKNNFILG